MRKREIGEKTLFRHFLFPWDMVDDCPNRGGCSCIRRGGKGLSTSDLEQCDFSSSPTWEGYPIANLSHAVNALCTRFIVLGPRRQGMDLAFPRLSRSTRIGPESA